MNKPKILIADDDSNILEILKTKLLSQNFDVTIAHDGIEAFEKINLVKPDVLISDWVMPNMDGIGLCKKVKSDSELESIYLIMLTAKDSLQDKKLAFDSGADDYVVKPYNFNELILRVEAGLRICKLHQNVADMEHLKAIRELSITLGHEINNPLGVMVLILQTILKKNDNISLKEIRTEIESCIKQGQRISEIIKKLSSLDNPIYKPYLDGSDVNMLDLQ